MSIRVDNTAHMFPGVFGWLCLVSIYLATGEWIASVQQAQQHPVLLSLLAVLTLVSAGLLARGSGRPSLAFVVGLLATALASGIVILCVSWFAHIRVFEFTL